MKTILSEELKNYALKDHAHSSISSPHGTASLSIGNDGVASIQSKSTAYDANSASVIFSDGFSLSYGEYESDSYTAPAGGETLTFVGPYESQGYHWWVQPSKIPVQGDYDPTNNGWALCTWESSSAGPTVMVYGTGPYYEISNWSSHTPTLSLSIGTASGSPPTMSHDIPSTTVKSVSVEGHTNPASSITGQLAIANGGTGASTASAALTNLGVPAAIQEKAGWLKNDGTSYSHPDANGKIVLIGGKYQSFRSLDFQDLNNIQVVKESGTENDCKIAVVGVRNLTGAQATIWGAYINASNYVYRVYWVNNGSYWLMQQYPPPIERTTAYATCSTASGTATKVVTVDGGGFTLSSGVTVCVKFSAASTDSSPKLNVNSTGDKAIYYNGSAASSTNPFKWSANTTVTFVYDGTGWNAVGVPTHYYATCSTTASTQAKVVTVQGGTGFVLTAGTMVDIRFTTANTYAGAATLNINSTGALTIRFNRSAVNGTNNPLFWTQTATLTFQLYPGSTSYWDVVNCERTEHAPCTTDAATVAKTGTLLARGIALAQGSRVVVKFTYANTAASPTFTMGGVGPYPICDSQGNALTVDSVENWGADEIVVFVFSYNSTKSAFQYQIENSYLARKLKAEMPAAQVNADWNASSGAAQVLNKPILGTAAAKDIASSGNASSTQVVMGNDTRLTDARTPTTHGHDAANISYNDNSAYNTVAACLTDLVNTNLWVENNSTNIMRGDETLTTLTLNGKSIATTDQIPDAQIQSDWNQTTTTAKDYIKNKPTIPAAQVNADWNETSSSSKAYIQNKPTLGTAAAKNVGTGASDVAAGNHTHSSLKNGNYTASLPTLTANDTIALASQIPEAQVNANWTETSSSSKAYIQNKPTLGTAASKDVGTASGTVAAGDHTHSDYVSKSATTDQAMSSSLTFPAGKTVEVGSFASASTYVASMYASSTESYMACGTGEQYTWIDKDGIKHTTDGENTVSTLLFPAASSTSRTIATDYDIRKMTRVLYESVTGDSSTPATSITISEDYNIYQFWVGSNGTFPTFTFSFPNFISTQARFQFTLLVHVDSGATTLTGPSGWVWVSGAGLPSSGFAGKAIWISGVKRTNDPTEPPLVSCWRCA